MTKNKFDTNNEALLNLTTIKEFLNSAKETTCEWGTIIDGVCLRMKALGINYTVLKNNPSTISYRYSDNFENSVSGNINF